MSAQRDPLREIAADLAAVLGASSAAVATAGPARLRVIAAWGDDLHIEPDADRDPWSTDDLAWIERDAARRFPGAVSPTTQAVVAVRLRAHDGTPLGLLIATHSAPLPAPPDAAARVRPYARAAAAEVARRAADAERTRDHALATAAHALAAHLADNLPRPDVMMAGACDLLASALEVPGVAIAVLDAREERFVPYAQHGPGAATALPLEAWAAIGAAPGALVEVDGAMRATLGDAALVAAGAHQGRTVVLLSVYGPLAGAGARALVIGAAAQLACAWAAAERHHALTQCERVHRRIVTTCLEGVWMVDASGRTTFVNPQLAALLGYAIDELLGRDLRAFMPERQRAIATVDLERRKGGTAERTEARLLHKSGHEVWVVLASNPIFDDRGAFDGVVMLVTDVTERRSLELKVQHAQRLESLGVLAGGIAHDFNNLLVGVLGNVGLALMDLPQESPAMPALRDIQAAALRAAELTKQMLTYSGKGRFAVERLNLNRIIESMAHLLESMVSQRAAIRWHLAPDLPSVDGDASQLRQVLVNLVSNAADALPPSSGLITIGTGVLHADRAYLGTTYLDEELTEGRYVYIEVADNGAGMDADTQQKIFDPFYTTKFPGRGLGLAAVLGILRGHRGAVKVYSEVDKGSTFKVLLPCPMSNDEPVEPKPTQPAPAAGALVLVADDEIAIRNVARRVLEKSGYRVLLAADGREAIELFRQSRDEVDAVLLDMTMPGPSGEDVFRELRRLRPEIRVVLTSGYNEEEATARFVGKGLAGFVQKPWRPADLVDALARALTAEST